MKGFLIGLTLLIAMVIVIVVVIPASRRWTTPAAVGVIRGYHVSRGAWNSADVTFIDTERGAWPVRGVVGVVFGDTLYERRQLGGCEGLRQISWEHADYWYLTW